MVAIVFSDPFWLMVSKGLFLYDLCSFLPCLALLQDHTIAKKAWIESVNETCYVYMGAIISSDPFWLVVSKGLLLYALSRFMPCLVFLYSVPVACCYLALNIAS